MQTNEDLIKRIAENVALRLIRIYANGGGGSFTMPLAADGVRGGVQVGYTTSAANRNYAVQLDNEKAYVNVPWTDHTYTLAGLVGGSDIGGSTQPIYWNGSSFVSTSYTLAKSVPSDAVFTDTNTWRPIGTGANDAAAGNHLHDDRYLKLAGGTMSGTLGLRRNAYGGPSGDHGLQCNNSDIVGVNSIYTNDTSDGWNEGIEFKRSNDNWDSMYALDGTFYFKSNNGSGDATVNVGNLYSAGYVTALSDARKKRVLGDIVISAEQIAQMPAVRFEWKDPEKPGMFIGTLAQNWREILPEAVHTMPNDDITFDYNSAAVVGLVNLAREVATIKSTMKRYGFK